MKIRAFRVCDDDDEVQWKCGAVSRDCERRRRNNIRKIHRRSASFQQGLLQTHSQTTIDKFDFLRKEQKKTEIVVVGGSFILGEIFYISRRVTLTTFRTTL